MVSCFNNKKCCGYHEHCDPHLSHREECCGCHEIKPSCCEKDIICAEPVLMCPCNPCWDNCRCTSEIKKLKNKTDKIEIKTNSLAGKIIKVENDIINLNENFTQQVGELADKEQSDIDNLQIQIDDEKARAKSAERTINDKLNKEIADRIEDVNDEQARAEDVENTLNDKIDSEISNRKSKAFASAEYNKNDAKLYFKNQNGTVISTIDVTDFVIDGMVSRVYIDNRELVIDWNADAGIQTTRIPLDQIFNPDNYYTKTQVDGLIDGVNDRIDTSNQNISNVSNRVDSLSSTVSGNTTQINNLSQQITNYGTQIDDLLSRVAALEQLWYNNNGVITAVGGKPVLTTGTSTAAGFYDSLISA